MRALRGLKEVAASSGSVCTSSSLEPSYVLMALGVDEADMTHMSIRFGLYNHNGLSMGMSFRGI